jgi:O-antigen/teichoic acid export membrane protein
MSFSNRYLFTLFSSVIRAGLNFYISIQIANYFLPELYGDYQYVLTMTTAMLLLINAGSENAFYTFISEKKRHFKFYVTYFSWQLTQLALLLITLIFLSQNAYDFLFKGTEVSFLVSALIAIFFLATIKNSLNHILESIRQTKISQALSIAVAVLHVALLLSFMYLEILNPKILFQIIMGEYILYLIIVVAILCFGKFELFSDEPFNLHHTFQLFWSYCKPLVLLAFAAALYTTVDRWLIQTYIGSSGQAYFAISMQFSTISILFASSLSSIFRKEISESLSTGNLAKARLYYQVVSKNIFLVTTMICTILFVYSTDVLLFFYGEPYLGAISIFKLIMLLPITQATGTVHVSFLYASSQTKNMAYISYLFIPTSIFLSILVISDFGLNLGIEGLGVRLLVTDTIYILVLEYFVCRYLDIGRSYSFKIASFTIFMSVAFFLKYVMDTMHINFLSQVILVSGIYVMPVGYYLYRNFKMQFDYDF